MQCLLFYPEFNLLKNLQKDALIHSCGKKIYSMLIKKGNHLYMKCDPNFVLKKYKSTEKKMKIRKFTNMLTVSPLGGRVVGDCTLHPYFSVFSKEYIYYYILNIYIYNIFLLRNQ